MYTNINLEIIEDNAPYNSIIDGTKYPRNWDKTAISELFPVTLVTQPTDVIIDGFHIELISEVYTQVWDTSALPAKTWDDVNNLQNQMLGIGTEALWRISRYKEQMEMTTPAPKETVASYQLLLDYRQDIRDNDITLNATPDLAIAALNDLTTPTAILT